MIFVFDLDGTICFKGQPLSPNITQALLDLESNGHEVIFASARPIRDMLPVLDKRLHPFKMIGGNGSLIAIDEKVIHSHSFSPHEIKVMKNLIEEYDATYLIDGEWDYAYTGDEHHPILQNLDPGKLAKLVPLDSLDSIVKVLFLTSSNMEELAEKLTNLSVYINRHRNENTLDISPKGINKWSSLKTLGVAEKSYIAFGNDANDIPLFEHALHSVMIGRHEQLANLATESIPLEGDYEQKIVKKIGELANKYKEKTH